MSEEKLTETHVGGDCVAGGESSKVMTRFLLAALGSGGWESVGCDDLAAADLTFAGFEGSGPTDLPLAVSPAEPRLPSFAAWNLQPNLQ